MPKLTIFRSGYWYLVPDKSQEQQRNAIEALRKCAYERRMAGLGYPEYIEAVNHRKKNAKLPLSWTTKSKAVFLSRGIKLNEQKTNRLKTFVLTYPENWEVKNTGKDLNRFFTNAKKVWQLEKYVWTCELQKNGQFHFHVIADMPKIPKESIWKFNRTWEKARQTPSEMNHKNGLTGFQTVKNQNKLLLYISKYISKSENSFKSEKARQFLKKCKEENHIQRCFNTSRNLNGNEFASFHSDIDVNIFESLRNNFISNCQTSKNTGIKLHFIVENTEFGFVSPEFASQFSF